MDSVLTGVRQRLFTVNRNRFGVIRPIRPPLLDFTGMRALVKVKIYFGHPPGDGLRHLFHSLET